MFCVLIDEHDILRNCTNGLLETPPQQLKSSSVGQPHGMTRRLASDGPPGPGSATFCPKKKTDNGHRNQRNNSTRNSGLNFALQRNSNTTSNTTTLHIHAHAVTRHKLPTRIALTLAFPQVCLRPKAPGAAPHHEHHPLSLVLHHLHQLLPGSFDLGFMKPFEAQCWKTAWQIHGTPYRGLLKVISAMRMMNKAGHLRADSPFRDVVAEVANTECAEGQSGVLQHLEDIFNARISDGVIPKVIGFQLLLQLAPNPPDFLALLAI